MSRVNEALKRAKLAAEGKPAPARVPPHTRDADGRVAFPSSELFSDAWTLGDAEAEAPAQHPLVPGGAADTPSRNAVSGQGAAADLSARSTGAVPGPAGDTPARTAFERGPGGALAPFQGFNPAMAEKIVATELVRPVFAEQYRKLASVLHHAQLERNLKVVLVTSSLAGEGKTLTSINLALTLSESYRRSVLLIDADLRRPTLHESFDIPNVTGLGDGLRADREQKLSLVQISPRLSLLTAGRPDSDPLAGLSSNRMRRVIEEAASGYDWVIVDTPPVGLLPDAKILVQMADAALLVIQAGRTPYPIIQRAIQSLGRERILGVVLNRAEDGIGGDSYYSYYDSYTKGKA
jgi:capsular exopolysaccharide synthesis family protein